MCGEQLRLCGGVLFHGGSPPRVRGTAPASMGTPPSSRITPACAGNSLMYVCMYVCMSVGITPACAGNSSGCASPKSTYRDHPRVCGEQYRNITPILNKTGSPPRVRGTEGCKSYDGNARRITPACAGNRLNPPVSDIRRANHPRVCGEQTDEFCNVGNYHGSPPRVRGTGPVPRLLLRRQRITPACAGNRTCRAPR